MVENERERREFAEMMLERLRAAGETRSLRFEDEQFRLVAEDGQTLFLGNCFAEHQAAPPAGRAQLLGNVVRSWFAPRREMPATFDLARADLLPAVRHRSFFELLKLEKRGEPADPPVPPARTEVNDGIDVQLHVEPVDPLIPPYRPFAEHLALNVVYDLPEAMQWISGSQLEEWETTFDQALEAALANLREISTEPLRRLAPGVYQSTWRDNYDASRLALPEVFHALELNGDPIVGIPNRDVLVVAGSRDEQALWMLCNIVEEAASQPRPLTTMLFRRLAEDVWEHWLPEPGTRHHARIHRLAMSELVGCYAEQKRLLEQLPSSAPVPPRVAELQLEPRVGTRVPALLCTWRAGVDTLLPWAEFVAFSRQGEEGAPPTIGGPWERVREVVGDLMEPQQLYPPRFRVRAFPSEQQLAEIGPLDLSVVR